MPDSILLYVLLVMALAIGFLLGRRERAQRRRRRRSQSPGADYFQGLNLLFSERPELAIDQFVEMLEVNEGSLDTHLAMGALLRRRGEIEKSIRIHQNLLAAPVLGTASKQIVEFELARDYHSAGLLDRAENLLIEISAKRGPRRREARELLLEIYEQEREWSKAIEVGSNLGHSDQDMRNRLSHFECELAEEALQAGDHKSARARIEKAIKVQPNQARGHALMARLEFAAKRYKRVQRSLQRAVELAPDLAEEFVDLYREACDNLGDEDAYEKFLRGCIQRAPHSALLRKWMSFQRSRGEEVDDEQLWQHASRQPGLHHLKLLLEAELGATERGTAINAYLQNLISREARYRCGNCGFGTGHLLWHCPTCRVWGGFISTEGPKDDAAVS